MPRKLANPAWLVAIQLLLSAANAIAQQTNAGITGTVTTASGGALPDAKNQRQEFEHQRDRQHAVRPHRSIPIHRSSSCRLRNLRLLRRLRTAPSLLTMPVKNEIPIRVEMTWHPAQ
jgi:hypothetical protein